MTNSPGGLLPVFVFLAAVGLSWPVALGAFALSLRVRPFTRALRYIAVAVAVLFTLFAVGLAVLVGPEVGVTVLAALAIAAGLFGALPLAIARVLLVRRGVGPGRSLRLAVAAWPPSMLAALAAFVAPGGASRYNVLFLEGVALYTALAVVAALVLFGPAVLGLLAARLGLGRRHEGVAAE